MGTNKRRRGSRSPSKAGGGKNGAAPAPAAKTGEGGTDKRDNDDDSGWTKDHHLVGTVLEGTALVLRERRQQVTAAAAAAAAAGAESSSPSREQQERQKQPARKVKRQSYASLEGGQVLQISCFHPEDISRRQPALWRGVFKPTSSPFGASMTPDGANRQAEEAAGGCEWKTATPVAVAIDRIAKDLAAQGPAPPSFLLAPPITYPVRNRFVTSLEERLQSVLYQHVVQEWLPSLILTAALEEVNQQCIRQAVRYQEQQQQQQQPSSSASGGRSKGGASASTWLTPEYYRRTPSSYLTPPTAAAVGAANDSLPSPPPVSMMNFTPNQLVSRIKQGCLLAYRHYLEHYYKPPPPPPPVAPTPALAGSTGGAANTTGTATTVVWGNERRASSRIARQQEQQQQEQQQQLLQAVSSSTAAAESTGIRDNSPPLLWKVAQGGKIADYLLKNLILTERTTDNVEEEEEEEEKEETKGDSDEQKEMEVEEEAKPSFPDNDLQGGVVVAAAAAANEQAVDACKTGENNSKGGDEHREIVSGALFGEEEGVKPSSPDNYPQVAAFAVANGLADDVSKTGGINPKVGEEGCLPKAVEEPEQDSKPAAIDASDSGAKQPEDEVATALLQQPEQIGGEMQDQGIKTSGNVATPAVENTEGQNGDTKEAAEDEDADSDSADPVDDEESGMITEKTNSKDDEDFNPEDDGDADEEDDAGHYVKENIQDLKIEEPPSSNTGDKSTHDEVVEEEDEVDDDAEGADVINDNPYLFPNAPAVLEWLGCKTGKLLTSSDLQIVFPDLLLKETSGKSKSKKKKSPANNKNVGEEADKLLSSLDRKIWRKIMGGPHLTIGGPTARLALQLFTEHEDEDVANWETSYFGRTHFTIQMLDEQNEYEQSVQASEDLAAEEMAFKQQKAWDTWRYKGIHGGFTFWPSWDDAVSQWWAENSASAATIADSDDAIARITSQTEETATDEDCVLAEQLTEQEAVAEATTRRTTRQRDPVLYSTQSGLTQKQLMDAILRITSEKGHQTVSELVSAVPDDSSDPLRRIRTSVGRLVWKRNQLACFSVKTEWTDDAVLNKLRKTPLQQVGLGAPLSEEAQQLNWYLQELHKTELQLRGMVIRCLTSVPVAIIATAADERHGSQECLDGSQFEDASAVEWLTSGHELLERFIFRPLQTSNTDDLSECQWFRIRAYSKSLASIADADEAITERPQIGLAKEPTAVECRMRFRAVRTNLPGDGSVNSNDLLLTEAQVHAGLIAAEVENKRTAKAQVSPNPFSGGAASRVTLFPPGGDTSPEQRINGVVVGHDTVSENDGQVLHKILVLPERSPTQRDAAFWATLDSTSNGSILCKIEGESSNFVVQQFDFHSSSPPFQECRAIVDYLERHPKAGPFLIPVDPIALNIPQYPDIVKHPMDISTVSKKLESGVYSNIAPGENAARSPIARMLNGPFRADIELIFDNAMLFNLEEEWIHQVASTIKKSVLKKIEQASIAADKKFNVSLLPKKSKYVEYDSDVDMYVYESDHDEDYDAPRKNRKRKHSAKKVLKEDASARPIERPCRLQKVLSESSGLRGPFADLPVNSDPSSFALPQEWTCRPREMETETSAMVTQQEDEEFDELLALHKQLEVSETAGLRRSTRSHVHDEPSASTESSTSIQFEYVYSRVRIEDDDSGEMHPTSRLEVELLREKLHENHFAKLYKNNQKLFAPDPESKFEAHIGRYFSDSFPPYLGRIVPAVNSDNGVWEIREPYIVAALRWVIRGLIHSNHLTALEEVASDSLNSGIVLVNNVYYVDINEKPFEVLDSRELIRRKRADQEVDDSSEEEVELSEYEKLRAERVARNAERLKALGLA